MGNEDANPLLDPFREETDADAANGRYIVAPEGAGFRKTPDSGRAAVYDVTIAQAGTFLLWGRTIAPDGGSDSFYVQVDGGTAHLWDVPKSSGWQWNPMRPRGMTNPLTLQLAAGTHVITVMQREDGTKLDKLLLTDDLVQVPTGLGD